MSRQRKPLFGALLIGTFITACLGLLFHGIGKPLPLWGYPLVLAVFVVWLYVVGRLLVPSGRNSFRARSFDNWTEVQ